MKFPPDEVCEKIAKLWFAWSRAINGPEGQAARAALQRLQAKHGFPM
jgi:hypothetical protein